MPGLRAFSALVRVIRTAIDSDFLFVGFTPVLRFRMLNAQGRVVYSLVSNAIQPGGEQRL